MAKDRIQVPFGYEPLTESRTGTLIVYDDFSDVRPAQLIQILQFAADRKFSLVVLYPIHEETARRMGIMELTPYHRRLEGLQEALEEAQQAQDQAQDQAAVKVSIDQWEGKRKKYTPVETALDFLTEKQKGPFFVWMPSRFAVKWAAYASFPEWIRKLRLVVAPPRVEHPPKALQEFSNRWEYAGSPR